MGLSTEMLAKLGPAFGQVPAFSIENKSAVRNDLPELALNSSADRIFTKAEEDILRLLSDGHSQEVVSSTLGITPSQVSQYLAKEDFRSELAVRKSKKLEKYKLLDDGYDRLEQTVLTKLENSLAFVSKPLELTAILSKLNAAKRRMSDPATNSSVPVQQIVQVVLPMQIIHQFTKTAEGHIVAVDNKSMVTIPSALLSKQASAETLQLENK